MLCFFKCDRLLGIRQGNDKCQGVTCVWFRLSLLPVPWCATDRRGVAHEGKSIATVSFAAKSLANAQRDRDLEKQGILLLRSCLNTSDNHETYARVSS